MRRSILVVVCGLALSFAWTSLAEARPPWRGRFQARGGAYYRAPAYGRSYSRGIQVYAWPSPRVYLSFPYYPRYAGPYGLTYSYRSPRSFSYDSYRPSYRDTYRYESRRRGWDDDDYEDYLEDLEDRREAYEEYLEDRREDYEDWLEDRFDD